MSGENGPIIRERIAKVQSHQCKYTTKKCVFFSIFFDLFCKLKKKFFSDKSTSSTAYKKQVQQDKCDRNEIVLWKAPIITIVNFVAELASIITSFIKRLYDSRARCLLAATVLALLLFGFKKHFFSNKIIGSFSADFLYPLFSTFYITQKVHIQASSTNPRVNVSGVCIGSGLEFSALLVWAQAFIHFYYFLDHLLQRSLLPRMNVDPPTSPLRRIQMKSYVRKV